MEEQFEEWYEKYFQERHARTNRKNEMLTAFEAGYQTAVDDERKQTYHIKNYMENKP